MKQIVIEALHNAEQNGYDCRTESVTALAVDLINCVAELETAELEAVIHIIEELHDAKDSDRI